jgi:hypothetical protein
MHSLSNLKGLCRPCRGLNSPVMAVVPTVQTLGYSLASGSGEAPLQPSANGAALYQPGATPQEKGAHSLPGLKARPIHRRHAVDQAIADDATAWGGLSALWAFFGRDLGRWPRLV